MNTLLRIAIWLAVSLAFAFPLSAQQADSGRVEVTIQESMGMLARFTVQSSGVSVSVMAIAAKQFGPLELVANFENLLNVRQTDTDPLVRPAPGMAGRWTTDM